MTEKFPSFLHFAVQFGLFKYVVEKTKEMKQDGRLHLNQSQAQSFTNANKPLLSTLCLPLGVGKIGTFDCLRPI